MKVSELMNTTPAYIYAGDSVQTAIEIMANKNRGLLVVFNNAQERKVVGVLSNKDIINRVMARRYNPDTIHVNEIMIHDFVKIEPEATTSDAMLLMRKHKIKRILVMDRDMLLGIVSSNDIIDAMIQYKKNLLDMALEF